MSEGDGYWQVPSETFQGMSWFSGGGTEIVGGVLGVYLIPYTTRFHELQFLKKKEIDCFRHSLSTHLNIAWTIEQLNLIFFKFFWTGAQKFTGAQKLLRGHDASASFRHPQMAPGYWCIGFHSAWRKVSDRTLWWHIVDTAIHCQHS